MPDERTKRAGLGVRFYIVRTDIYGGRHAAGRCGNEYILVWGRGEFVCVCKYRVRRLYGYTIPCCVDVPIEPSGEMLIRIRSGPYTSTQVGIIDSRARKIKKKL